MPVILFGCLYSGITTPTEAAALAAPYALLASALLYRAVTWRSVYASLATSARVTISTGILIPAAMVFNYDITVENLPKPLALLLFMMVKIAEVSLKDLVRELMPFLAAMLAALALITFIPSLVLFLPRLLGYQG